MEDAMYYCYCTVLIKWQWQVAGAGAEAGAKIMEKGGAEPKINNFGSATLDWRHMFTI